MPNQRVCPQCGRQAHDALMIQCPDCRVPFVGSGRAGEPVAPAPSPVAVTSILGSWQFWAVLVFLVGVASGAVVMVADKIIEARSRETIKAIEARNANQMGLALTQISNQINAAFRQPRIKSAIDEAAWARASDLFSNDVKPSVEAFQEAVEQARAQLAGATNLIGELESNALAAQKRIPPPQTNTPVAAVAAPVAEPVTPTTPAADLVKLVMINHSVIPAGSNYLLTLFFRTVGTPVTGSVDMAVATYKQTARILSFTPMSAQPSPPAVINPAGDIAQLRFGVTDREPPTLVLEVSGPTIVRFVSDSMDGNLTLPIAADKMPIPAPAN